MSRKTNKLISKEGKKDYSEEAAEETIEMSQGGDEFDGADKEFEEARAEDIAFYRAHAEERAGRSCLQRVRNMNGYATGTANDPEEEEEEEENPEGDHKQPAMNPIGGSRVWGK